MAHEKWLFLGATCSVMLLIAIGIYFYHGAFRDRYTTSWLLGTIVLFALSLGPMLIVNNKRTHIYLPYLLFYYLVPGFSSLGVPSRIGLVWVFPVACMASFALSLLMYYSSCRNLSTFGVCFASILIASALWESRTSVAMFPFPANLYVPPVYTWLGKQKINGGVLDWPVGEQGFSVHEYMYFQLFSSLPTVHGYSGLVPSSYPDILQRFDDPSYDTLRYLKTLGISTVVYHKRLIPSSIVSR